MEEGSPIKGWSCAEMDAAISQQLDNMPFKNAKGEPNAKFISDFKRWGSR